MAVRRLFEEHGARLYRLGVRFCGDADEAHDLVQDVFLQAFRSWKQFDGRSSPSTWLYTIAARRCQRRHRRRAGEPASMTSLSSVAPSPHDRSCTSRLTRTHSTTQSGNSCRTAWHQPWRNCRREFGFRSFLRRSPRFRSRTSPRCLGLKLGTVKSRVHRARLAVRERIAAGLPSRPAPASDHEHRFCKDLLQAKQEALDRGVPLLVSDGDLCDRCRSLFATLDLSRDVCRLLAQGEIPPELATVVDVAKSTAARRPDRKVGPASGPAIAERFGRWQAHLIHSNHRTAGTSRELRVSHL